MSDEETVAQVGSWVPEIYYDVIARVTPGCVTLAGIGGLAVLGGFAAVPPLAKWKDMSLMVGSLTVLAIIGTGYVLGHLITPFGRPAFRTLAYLQKGHAGHSERHLFQAHSTVMVKAISSVPMDLLPTGVNGIAHIVRTGMIRPEDNYQLDHFLHEYIRLMCPQALGVITKMRAELSCCRNLTAASVALVAMAGIAWVFRPHCWLAIPLGLLLLVLAMSAATYRQAAYYERIISFLYLIHRTATTTTTPPSVDARGDKTGTQAEQAHGTLRPG